MENNGNIKKDGFIDRWMQIAAPAKKEILERKGLITLDEKIDGINAEYLTKLGK